MTYHAGTWRLKSGSASWDYELVYDESEPPNLAYARLVGRFISACEGFAVPDTARLTTGSGGEDAHVFDLRDSNQRDQLHATMTATDDVEDVEISLTLVYEPTTFHQGPAMVPGGATAWLSRETDADDRQSPFRLLFSLAADLYAFVSWGKQRDNTVLAARNAPRLEMFLRRLESQLGGMLKDIDAPSYQGQAHAYGFRPPQ